MATLNFNANDVPPAESFEAIPAGNYLGVIEETDLTETKSKTGLMLVGKANIVEGPYANRKLWFRINVQNQNSQAQEIGQRQLSQLCHAAGKIQVGDSSELHLIPIVFRVGFQKDDPTRNEIKEFKPVNGQASTATTSRPAFNAPRAPAPAAPASAPAFAQQPAATAGNSSKPAWAR